MVHELEWYRLPKEFDIPSPYALNIEMMVSVVVELWSKDSSLCDLAINVRPPKDVSVSV
jgi:hypothetical protein